MPPVKYLNLPELAGKVSTIRSAEQRNRLVGMQIEDIEAGRATKKTRKNVMAEFYNPPGTKAVKLGEDIQGPENVMATPGGYDWKGASAALAGKGDIKGALETAKAGREAKKAAVDLKIKQLNMGKAEREQTMSNINLLGRLSKNILVEYEKARNNGLDHKGAQQAVDAMYDEAGAQLIALGFKASDIPQSFDPIKARGAIALMDEAGQVDIEHKKAQTAKLKAEAGKIRREAGKTKLTSAQQSNNAEIDNARRVLSSKGVNRADIKRLTSKSTETGRENRDYDPDLARVVSKALQRKVGDDPQFKTISNIYQLGKPGDVPSELKGAEKQLKSKKIVKRGTHKGRKVVQYQDGSVEYAD